MDYALALLAGDIPTVARLGAQAYFEVVLGVRQLKPLEEHAVHAVRVVLPCVQDEELDVIPLQLLNDERQFFIAAA